MISYGRTELVHDRDLFGLWRIPKIWDLIEKHQEVSSFRYGLSSKGIFPSPKKIELILQMPLEDNLIGSTTLPLSHTWIISTLLQEKRFLCFGRLFLTISFS